MSTEGRDDPVVIYPCPMVRALTDALTNGAHDGE